jgi:hypothetical protein
MAQYFPETLRAIYRAVAGVGHSIGSPTSNGNATKYVIPAMAHLYTQSYQSLRSGGTASTFPRGIPIRNGGL